MNLRTITDPMMDHPIYTIVGIGFALLFLPMHTIRPDEYWVITRMGWWIGFLIYVSDLHTEYKENGLTIQELPTVRHPTASAWVSRWGVSWRALAIIIPSMLVTFFFIMLVVFA